MNKATHLLPFFPLPTLSYCLSSNIFNSLYTWRSVPAPGMNPTCPYPMYFFLNSLSVTMGSSLFFTSASTTQIIIGWIVSNLIFLVFISALLSFTSGTILDLYMLAHIFPSWNSSVLRVSRIMHLIFSLSYRLSGRQSSPTALFLLICSIAMSTSCCVKLLRDPLLGYSSLLPSSSTSYSTINFTSSLSNCFPILTSVVPSSCSSTK